MVDQDELIVEGFLFATQKDADLANTELQKIKYLNKNVNYANLPKVKQVYDKLLDEKQFRTPVGFTYLLYVRELLLKEGIDETQIRPIPMYSIFSFEKEKGQEKVKVRVKHTEKKKKNKETLHISIGINILLVLCVIGMFYIAMHSETPNILNYKQNLINEYSSWEQELTERENAVRVKMRELDLTFEKGE